MAEAQQTKRQRQAAATKEQLLAAARVVFETKGYAGTTVGAITSAAATAHGTFYLYFRNKEDAFSEVMSELAAELYEVAGAAWDPTEPRASIEHSIRSFLDLFCQHCGLWRSLLEASFTNPAIETMWVGVRSRFVERIARNLTHLRDDGSIRPLNVMVTANALGAMVEWAATTHFVLRTPPVAGESLEEAVTTLADLWYHAVYVGT